MPHVLHHVTADYVTYGSPSRDHALARIQFYNRSSTLPLYVLHAFLYRTWLRTAECAQYTYCRSTTL